MEQPRPLTPNSLPAGAAAFASASGMTDVELVKTGAESGLGRFFEQAFISPESARLGAQSLLRAFDDNGMWLASLVQPVHLVAELRQQSCLVTHAIVTQWTRQGETHKLVKLAEALTEAQPPVLTHEAGQVMALLASLLGILRPVQAPRWLSLSMPLLKDSVDPHLLQEGKHWVKVGQLLSPLPAEDRLFWNRRLREPEDEWEWDSPEALDALERVAPLLENAGELLPVFKAVLPACWMELWREQQRLWQEIDAESKPDHFTWIATFGLGMFAGMSCLGFFAWTMGWMPPAEESQSERSREPLFSFYQVEEPASLSAAAEPTVGGASAKKQELDATPLSPVAATIPHAIGGSPPVQSARMGAIAKISEKMPHLERLHNLVKMATPREATPYVLGQTTMASQGSAEHRGLIRWLMLDPPKNLEVNDVVARAAVRVLGALELYETLKLCIEPGSPNRKQAQECAALLLSLGGENLDHDQKSQLAVMADVGSAP